jgi:hypothetical protein
MRCLPEWRGNGLPWFSDVPCISDLGFQSNATAAGLAHGTVADQFDAGFIQGRNKLGERLDIAADNAVAGFHPLDRGQGKIGKFSKLALINSDQRSSGSHLSRSNHALDIES